MPFKSTPDLWSLLGAVIVSCISGFVSIARRILDGQQASVLWIVSEFMTAILAGYLMFVTYPDIQSMVPKWFTLPVAVALAAHMGGRIFQESEQVIMDNFIKWTTNQKRPSKSKPPKDQ